MDPTPNSGPVVDGPVVPFGRYKGRSVAELMADPGYVDWVMAQGWVRDRFPTFYQVIVNGGFEPSDTPEHNKLQAKFLDPAYCLAVVAAGFAAGGVLATPKSLIETLAKRADVYITSIHVEPGEVSNAVFEQHNWDVSFTYRSCSVPQPGPKAAPPCECFPLITDEDEPWGTAESYRQVKTLREQQAARHLAEPLRLDPVRWQGVMEVAMKDGTTQWLAPAMMDPANLSFESYKRCRIHTPSCPRSSYPFYFVWISGQVAVAATTEQVRVELKPQMGDDYPSVLRQILQMRRSATDRVALVVGAFTSSAVDLEVVRQTFARSEIVLISEAELDDQVMRNRALWTTTHPLAPRSESRRAL